MKVDAPAGTRHAALVYNPTKVDRESLRRLVTQMSQRAQWDPPHFYETTPEDLGQEATKKALNDGAAAVLVAGGDGTVRAVSEAIAGTGVPLTIVPSGTGNLLARNLNLPLNDTASIIEATFSGTTVPVDAGRVRVTRENGDAEDHVFVVMAGIGLDAAMIANTNPKLKKSVGWVAYVDGAARSLPSAQPFRVMYQLDRGRMHAAKVHSVLFANCGALPAGIALIPDASITDGVLDVCVFQPRGWFGWVTVWRRVWWENSVLRWRSRRGRSRPERGTPSVRYLKGHGFDLATHPARAIQLDGDEFGEATSIRCEIDPGALLVAVPANHPTAGL